MEVSTFIKRGFLRAAKLQAVRAQQSLSEYLLSILEGRLVCVVDGGRVRISGSTGDVSSGWTVAFGAELSAPSQVLKLVSELLDRYDAAEAKLEAAGSDLNDQATYQQMLDDLVAIKGYTSNWGWLTK